MKNLRVTDLDGDEFDVLSLVKGSIRYSTGIAKDMIEKIQKSSGLADADLFDTLDGWSNGYIIIEEKRQ